MCIELSGSRSGTEVPTCPSLPCRQHQKLCPCEVSRWPCAHEQTACISGDIIEQTSLQYTLNISECTLNISATVMHIETDVAATLNFGQTALRLRQAGSTDFLANIQLFLPQMPGTFSGSNAFSRCYHTTCSSNKFFFVMHATVSLDLRHIRTLSASVTETLLPRIFRSNFYPLNIWKCASTVDLHNSRGYVVERI